MNPTLPELVPPEDHEVHRWEEDGGKPLPEPRPFEEAIFEALEFTAVQVQKVDVSIGPRSQSVTFKFGLTPDQVEQLNAMASGG